MRATEEAYLFLEENNVSNFPLNFPYLANRMDVELMPYSKFPEECVAHLYTQDGFTVLTDDGVPKIIYNDRKPIHRVNFTIAHEIGHIKLGHIYKKINTLFSYVIEQEANCFARNILAPFHEVLKLKNITPTTISNHFKISIEASHIRLKYLSTDMYNYRKNGNKMRFYFNYKEKI